MKHKIGFNKLNISTAHRRAMLSNMMVSLFKYERIQTTVAKAKELRRFAEKELTRAKIDSVHNRRMTGRRIKDKAIVSKLFKDLGPRFKERKGGYTRILRTGFRRLDNAQLAIIELVERREIAKEPKSTKKTKENKKAAS